MGIFDRKDIIKIVDEDIKDASLSSSGFTDELIRKRAFADVLGARLAMKLLFSHKIEATNLYSLYTIHKVLSDMDIADISLHNMKVEARLVFDENQIFVPKSHFDYDIAPDLYLFLLLDSSFQSAECIGFIEPENINKENTNGEFYFVEKQELEPIKNLKKSVIKFKNILMPVSTEEEISRAAEMIIPFTDGELSEDDKKFLFKQLSMNFDLREKFVEFENFELLSCNVAKKSELFTDNMLEIVGAQQVYNNDENGTLNEADVVTVNVASEDNEDGGDGTLAAAVVVGGVASAAIGAGAAIASEIISSQANVAAASASAFSETLSATSSLVSDISDVLLDPSFDEVVFEEKEEVVFENSDDEIDLDEIDKFIADSSEESDFEIIEEEEEIESVVGLNDFDFDMLSDVEEVEEVEEIEDIEIQDEIMEEPEEVVIDEPIIEELSLESIEELPSVIELEPLDDFDEEILELDEPEISQLIEEPIVEDDLPDDNVMSFDDIKIVEDIEESTLDFIDDDIDDLVVVNDELEDNLDDSLISEVDELLNSDIELSDSTLEVDELLQDDEPEFVIQDDFEEADSDDIEFILNDGVSDTPNVEDENDVLKVLFEKEHLNIEEEEDDVKPFVFDKKKKIIAAAVLSGVIAVTLIGTVSMVNNKKNAELANTSSLAEAPQAMPQQDMPMDMGAPAPSGDMGGMPMPTGDMGASMDPNRDMGQAVSDAFSAEAVGQNISKIAWEVPEDLAYNDAIRKYLQIAGKSLKLSLQNDLLLTTELAYSPKMVIDLKLTNSGFLQSSNVIVSSGSKQIDKIVLQSVKDTLNYVKLPSGEVRTPSVNATLIINF